MKLLPAISIMSIFLAAPAFAHATPAAQYVKAAGASDLFERQSAQIVLKTTTNPKIRDFATMMLTAHAKSTAMVKAAAARARIKVAPPALKPAQVTMIAQLREATGAARDATYITQQKTAHGEALAVQQSYASSGASTALKLAAVKIVPVVKMHIAMLDAM